MIPIARFRSAALVGRRDFEDKNSVNSYSYHVPVTQIVALRHARACRGHPRHDADRPHEN
jgi:hypothetical protein